MIDTRPRAVLAGPDVVMGGGIFRQYLHRQVRGQWVMGMVEPGETAPGP